MSQNIIIILIFSPHHLIHKYHSLFLAIQRQGACWTWWFGLWNTLAGVASEIEQRAMHSKGELLLSFTPIYQTGTWVGENSQQTRNKNACRVDLHQVFCPVKREEKYNSRYRLLSSFFTSDFSPLISSLYILFLELSKWQPQESRISKTEEKRN